MRGILAFILVVSVLGCVSSGPSEDSTATTQSSHSTVTVPARTQSPTTTVAKALTEKLMTSSTPELGGFLVDSNGMTLYTFKSDEDGKSNCYGDCAALWPPLITPDDVFEGDGSLVGVIGYASRTDGLSQVTFNGAPLYHYAQDKSPGDVKGEGVGGLWYVVVTSAPEETSATEEAPVKAATETAASSASESRFTFNPDTDTYSLSDTFGPTVEVAPLNPEHNYTIVIYMHSDGGSPGGGTDTQSMTGAESTTVWLHPFTNDQTGYSSENERFTMPGVHHFEISVYDCTAIEASTGVENCARGKKLGIMEKWEFPDAMENQEPAAKTDKAITVVEG